MDFLSATVLSGVVYDMFKTGVSIKARDLSSKLKEWLIDEPVADALEMELKKLALTDDISEVGVQRRIEQSEDLKALLQSIKPRNAVNIANTHYGSGDIVGGDKIINNN